MTVNKKNKSKRKNSILNDSLLQELLNKGRENGFIAHAELKNKLFSDNSITEDMDTIISLFNESGVLVTKDDKYQESALEVFDEAPAATAPSETEEVVRETGDAVKMYLRNMSERKLLGGIQSGSTHSGLRALRATQLPGPVVKPCGLGAGISSGISVGSSQGPLT